MTVADARDLGHGFVGEAVMGHHCNPALHALVGILGVSHGRVAKELGLTRGRMSHYLTEIDPIPYDRRKGIADILVIALDALDESLAFAKTTKGQRGRPKYTQGGVAFVEAARKECHRLLRLEQKALKKMAVEMGAA